MGRPGNRQHIAQHLERRFAPLFWLARTRLSYDELERTWEMADELDRLLERAGFGFRISLDSRAAERAKERGNPYRRASRLAARWDLPDNPVTTSLAAQWASADDPMTRLNPAAAKLAYLVNDVGSLFVGFTKDYTETVDLLEALSTMDRRRRRTFLRWVQRRPFFKAQLSLEGGRIALRPDPRDLRTCIWVLAAELIAGGWPVKRCLAPKCGRYIGQWTKRERLFCDEGCRTDYHNAQRTKLGKESAATAETERARERRRLQRRTP